MKKPKIFYLSTSLNIGGTEKFLLTLAKRLSVSFDISAGVIRAGGTLESALKDSGVSVTKVPMPWQIANHLKIERIDILHTFLFWAHIFGRLGARMASTPFVVTTQQAVDIWKKPYHTFLDKATAPLCDYFIANSSAAARRLNLVEKVPMNKIGIVYNGIDIPAYTASGTKINVRQELNIPADTFVVSCVSRLHYDKGVDFLPDIALRSPGCTFILAGDGPYRDVLRSKIEKLGISSRFILCGWRQDTANVLKASNAFILPSREESFPQAALEAMAAGIPVIASNVGGVSELVNNNIEGFLIKPGDTSGFSAAVNRLAADPSLLSLMSKRAFERASLFSEDRMISSIAGIYDKLLSLKHSPVNK